MQRSRYITDDPIILIQRNDHISSEARCRYITDDPIIRLHFAKKRKKKKKKKVEKKMNKTDCINIIVHWNWDKRI